jgi:hypothetical protein
VKICHGNQIFITLLEDGTLDVQKDGGQSISCVLGADRDLNLEWVEEEEDNGMVV